MMCILNLLVSSGEIDAAGFFALVLLFLDIVDMIRYGKKDILKYLKFTEFSFWKNTEKIQGVLSPSFRISRSFTTLKQKKQKKQKNLQSQLNCHEITVALVVVFFFPALFCFHHCFLKHNWEDSV